MTALLVRLFVRDSQNTNSPAVRSAYGTMVSIVCICINVLLFAGKFLAGTLTGSVAITADAVNNLSDAGTSLISLVTFRISAKPADRDHPYGHARIEYVASMIVAFLVLHIGLDLFGESIGKLRNPGEGTVFSPISVVILIVAIAAKLWMALFNRKIGRRIGSAVMEAAVVDSLADVLSTSAVLISTLVLHFTHFDPDGYIGLLVAAMILFSGVKILNETKNHILGTAPDHDVIEAIRAEVQACPGAIGMHDLMVHNYGPGRCFASLHVEVDGREDIFITHDRIDNLERDIGDKLGIACVVHMDPIVTDDETVNRLREMTLSLVRTVDERLTVHDFRCVVGETHTNLIFDLVVPFECNPDLLSARVATSIHAENAHYYAVITVDRG